MGDKYEVYDEHGRKIGTAERVPSGADQAVGLALFVYLFWKPLLILAIIIGLIATPFLIVGGILQAIDSVRTASENPTLEQQFNQEISTTVAQGINLLNTSLRSGYADPNLNQYFTSDAVKEITDQIADLKRNGQLIDQNVTMGKVNLIRYFEGQGHLLNDAKKMSQVTFACISARVTRTRAIRTTGGAVVQPSQVTDYNLRFGLIRSNGQWRILEASDFGADTAQLGVKIDDWRVITSYCRD